MDDLSKKYHQLMTMVNEDKEIAQNFQRQCEGDIKSLRNLTLDFMASAKGLLSKLSFLTMMPNLSFLQF